jgi:hypothetical protein
MDQHAAGERIGLDAFHALFAAEHQFQRGRRRGRVSSASTRQRSLPAVREQSVIPTGPSFFPRSGRLPAAGTGACACRAVPIIRASIEYQSKARYAHRPALPALAADYAIMMHPLDIHWIYTFGSVALISGASFTGMVALSWSPHKLARVIPPLLSLAAARC